MTREEKNKTIDELNAQLVENKNFYLTDIAGLDAGSNSELRRLCFKSNVQLQVIKNTGVSACPCFDSVLINWCY